MRKNITKLLAGVACLFAFGVSTPSFADAPAKTEPVAAATTAAVATPEVAPLAVPPAAPAAAAAAAPAPAAAPAAAPVPNKGDTGFMMVCAILVILMTIPGLALFYGGLVRSKNMLSILMQVFMVFSLVVVLWCIYGYSLAFTEGNAFFGTFARAFLNGIWDPATGTFAVAATFSKGVVIPEFVFVAFQGTFAAITCALIVGAFAERAKFSAVLAFVVLWFTFAYLPAAHMVWFWTGPDMITDAASVAVEAAKAGWIYQKGALDFAGGTVVHINAAVAGLVGAILTGVFAAPQLGGQGIFDYVTNKISTDPYSIGHQVWVQAQAVGTTVIWSAVVSVIAYKLVDIVIGLRVPEEEEREGLDITSHGEQAYHN